MQPVIPLDKILERMREERQPERPALRLYAPEPSPNDPRDHELQSLISRFDISLTF